MKRIYTFSLLVACSVLLTACAPEEPTVKTTPVPTSQSDNYATPSTVPTETTAPTTSPKGKAMAETKQIVAIETAKGTIEVELYPEKAPNTVKNFLDKAKAGFYKNLIFHRVEDWVIQGGDPDGNGTGGGKMKAEYNDVPFVEGSLGIARGMDKSQNNDSQFFICTTDCAWLTNEYTNFGKVTKGMDIAKKIAIGDKIVSVQSK